REGPGHVEEGPVLQARKQARRRAEDRDREEDEEVREEGLSPPGAKRKSRRGTASPALFLVTSGSPQPSSPVSYRGGHSAASPSRSISRTLASLTPNCSAMSRRDRATPAPRSWASTRARKISLRRSSVSSVSAARSTTYLLFSLSDRDSGVLP